MSFFRLHFSLVETFPIGQTVIPKKWQRKQMNKTKFKGKIGLNNKVEMERIYFIEE